MKLVRKIGKWVVTGWFTIHRTEENNTVITTSYSTPFLKYETQEIQNKQGVTDILLKLLIDEEFYNLFEKHGGKYLVPIQLSDLPDLQARIGLLYFLEVYPYGFSYFSQQQIQVYIPSRVLSARDWLNSLLSSWNKIALQLVWEIPSTGEIREGNPPLLFYKQPNGAYLFYTANTYFLDNGLTKGGTQEEYIKLPQVFELKKWIVAETRKHGYYISPAFSFLQSLSEQHPDLVRFSLLLLDEYMNVYGKEQTNTFLSSIVKATPTKYKGHIALRKLFEEIPEHDKVYLFDRDFIRAFISYLQETGFLDNPITHRFLHNIRDALKDFLPAYIEKQEDMLLEDVITLSEEQKKAFELVWKSSPSLQEEYLKKLVGEEELKSLSETQKRVLLVRAKQIFLQEMAKGL